MARFNITLPGTIAKMLDEDAERQDMARSTLIAQYIEQHYEGKSKADIEAEIQQLRTESADIVQRARNEHEKRVEKLIAEHETEVHQLRVECEKQVEQINAERSASIQQLEDSLQELENVTEKLNTDLTEANERNCRLQKSCS